jgi:hypothetical protein
MYAREESWDGTHGKATGLVQETHSRDFGESVSWLPGHRHWALEESHLRISLESEAASDQPRFEVRIVETQSRRVRPYTLDLDRTGKQWLTVHTEEADTGSSLSERADVYDQVKRSRYGDR